MQLVLEASSMEVIQGNQDVQNRIYKALYDLGVKRKDDMRDPKSGGMRTYMSQLICLGLVFINETGKVFPTIAGEAVASGIKPLEALQSLLLRHQYPSCYAHMGNVSIHPALRIKPFLFIMELMNDSDLSRKLYPDEIAIPVVYGHNWKCYDLCKRKILELRSGRPLAAIIDNPKEDLYTIRNKTPELENGLYRIKDIANIVKNYLLSCLLIISVKDEYNNEILINNTDYEDIFYEYLDEKNKFIGYSEINESFQRALGKFDKVKDTRKLDFLEKAPVGGSERIIRSLFYKYSESKLVDAFPEEFAKDITVRYGIPEDEVGSVVESLQIKNLSTFEDNYIKLAYSGINRCIEFESATAEIFHKRMPFFAKHTGQMKRNNKVGGYADILLLPCSRRYCALVDTKASPGYTITSNDYAKAVSNYIPNYSELCPELSGLKLKFFLYVAGGFTGKNDIKQKSLKKETSVHVPMISAMNLLKLSNHSISKNQRKLEELFFQEKIISPLDFN